MEDPLYNHRAVPNAVSKILGALISASKSRNIDLRHHRLAKPSRVLTDATVFQPLMAVSSGGSNNYTPSSSCESSGRANSEELEGGAGDGHRRRSSSLHPTTTSTTITTTPTTVAIEKSIVSESLAAHDSETLHDTNDSRRRSARQGREAPRNEQGLFFCNHLDCISVRPTFFRRCEWK